MKAVIYARYSSDSQREESIEGQIRECTAFAEKNGITILRHYIDRAVSAKTDNRPEFQNMVKDSNKKLFDMVIVWKLDRFARNRYDSARYKAQLKKNGVKAVHHYYKCVTVKKKRGDCHKKAVRKQWIEDLGVNATEMLNYDHAIEAIVSMLMDLQDRENINLPLYEQQLNEVNLGINNLLNAIQQGILTKSTKTRLEELENTRDELENKIALEKLAKPKISAEFMTFWLHRFRKLDVTKKEHRQMLIDAFINAIFLYDDKVLITFNYKEGTKTITFNDVNKEVPAGTSGSDLDCLTAPEKSTQLRLSAFFNEVRLAGAISAPSVREAMKRGCLRCCEMRECCNPASA